MTTDRRWSAPERGRTSAVCVECRNGVLGPDSICLRWRPTQNRRWQ